MFQLTQDEFDLLKQSLIFQNGISNDSPKTQDGIGRTGRGGTRKLPYAFTEQGLAMLSGILNSDIAIDVNIKIMRAFVAIRQALPTLASRQDIDDLRQRIKLLEEASSDTRHAIADTKQELSHIYEALTQLGEKSSEPLPEIGFAAIQKRREKL